MLTPSVTIVVSYGTIGMKSLAMTVMLWLSILNFWIAAIPVLINLSLCFLPLVKLNLDKPALLTQVPMVLLPVLLPHAKSILPLIKLLSDAGRTRLSSERSVPMTPSKTVK